MGYGFLPREYNVGDWDKLVGSRLRRLLAKCYTASQRTEPPDMRWTLLLGTARGDAGQVSCSCRLAAEHGGLNRYPVLEA